MYIEIHNFEDLSQKVLYFKLNNSFNMDTDIEKNIKFSGIYAIYSNDICLYVGQSNNLASRLATHLKGKYSKDINIYAWDIQDIGFGNYFDRNECSRKAVLDNCEQWFMKQLKPIENINIDFSKEFKDNEVPSLSYITWASFSLELNNISTLRIKSNCTDDEMKTLYESIDFRVICNNSNNISKDETIKDILYCLKSFPIKDIPFEKDIKDNERINNEY